MKNKRIVYVSIVLIIVILLYVLGFRIVYSPSLENNWDAISAIGTWVGVFATIAIALIIHNHSNMISPTVRFINFSLTEDNPYLVVTNTG